MNPSDTGGAKGGPTATDNNVQPSNTQQDNNNPSVQPTAGQSLDLSGTGGNIMQSTATGGVGPSPSQQTGGVSSEQDSGAINPTQVTQGPPQSQASSMLLIEYM